MQLHTELQSRIVKYFTAQQLKDSSLNNFLIAINDYFIEKDLEVEQYSEKENKLAKTNQLLTTLFSKLNSGILAEDQDRKVLFTNQMYCDIFSTGISPTSMIGSDFSNSAEDTKGLFKKPVSYVAEIDKLLHFKEIKLEQVLEMKDGKYFERNYMPIYINETYKGTLWKYTDVTEKIITQKELKLSEENYRNIIEHATDIIYKTDNRGFFVFVNPIAERITGFSKEELFKMHFSKLIRPDFKLKAVKFYLSQVKNRIASTYFEFPIVTKRGQEVWLGQSVQFSYPQVNSQDYELTSMAIDITKQKLFQGLLKKQEEKYRNIITNMNLGLIEVGLNEEILHVNQGFCDMSGFSHEELIGKNARELFVLNENLDLLEEKKKLRSESISDVYQMHVKNKNGETRWWTISGAPNFNDSGEFIGSIGIHLDITDQKKLEEDLETAKIKAEAASKAKEVFLANMSHEIRTPLNAIIGMIRELGKEKLTVDQKIYVENSSIASKHLLSIINNILDISKIEAGELTLDSEHFMLDQSINNILSIMSSRVEEKGIYLKSELSPQIHKTLVGDPLRLEQVLLNLVGNAVKFTDNGGINIKCDLLKENELEQTIQIAVSDTGIGMDEHYLKSIFKKFSQEDKSVARKYGGTGLGLAITSELMQLMNGSIDVKSEKKLGTSFIITITLGKDNASNVKSFFQSNEVINLDGVRILLVEDNDVNRLVAQNTFKHYNCTVDEAVNGLEALQKVKKNNYDIILMDIQMPEMDGLEATQRIRNELRIDTPIIALTANAFKSEVEKTKLAGMNDYIIKPFEEVTLLKLISKYTNVNFAQVSQSIGNVVPMQISKSYDLCKLKELSRGDNEFINKMITLFIEQATISLQQINTAYRTNDFDMIHKAVHRLKPSIDNMCIISLKNEIRELESLTNKEIQTSQLSELIKHLNENLLKVIEELPLELI
ncbi:MAG: PAS domain S-box protein [Bacteroidetes bacterium]|nr:PAS domain S-box protein [Bacteroidota bacterium]